MTLSEFDIIERYFRQKRPYRNDVALGVGDDAALLQVPEGHHLVVAIDTLVAGRHFPSQADAFDIGYKALAVNLSDLAAMGADPAWATLSLTIPEVDEAWLQRFSAGFFQLANRFGVDLVGGDTTCGPLSITVQVHGLVESGLALRRDSAHAGQKLFVTGTTGDAAYALRQLLSGEEVTPALLERLHRPQPRVEFGLALKETGAAVIDISDGLLADLGHIVEASHCGAELWVDRLPRSEALKALPLNETLDCQLAGGDDYELCFAVDADKVEQVQRIARQQQLQITEIGIVERRAGIICHRDDGSLYTPRGSGFDHFDDQSDH